jgi:putative transposase
MTKVRKVLLDTTDLLVGPMGSYRPVAMSDDGWVFTQVAEGLNPGGLAESFTHVEIRGWMKSTNYARYPYYFDPSKALHRLAKSGGDFSAMETEEADRILWREDFCESTLELHAKGKSEKAARKGKKAEADEPAPKRLVLTEVSIEEHLADIVDFVNARIKKRGEAGALPVDRKRKRKLRAYVKQTSRQPPCARSILQWTRVYKRENCNPLALRDRQAFSGNWKMKIGDERAEIMSVEVPKYAHEGRPLPTTIRKNINDKIDELNEQREVPLPHVDIRTVYRAIERLDKYQTMFLREGKEYTNKHLAWVASDYRNDHVGHRIQIDEWQVDLYNLALTSGIWEHLTDEEKRRVKKLRRWLWIAIDTASRMTLGLFLSETQAVEGALAVLEQVCSDKTHLALAVGAKSRWDHAVTPKLIETDWGAGYIRSRFRRAVADLGCIKVFPEAGNPGARGFVESMAGTAAILVAERIKLGKAWNNPVARRDYPSLDRAGLTDDELAYAILRLILDCYHASPHSELRGATPLDEWDRLEALHGAPPPPDRAMHRSLFGLIHRRVVTNQGVRFLGNYYRSAELGKFFINARSNIEGRSTKKQRELEVRVDQKNLGAISVNIRGRLYPLVCEDPDMEGRDAATWIATVGQIKDSNQRKAELRRSVVRQAYADVEALTQGAQKRSTIAPKLYSAEEIDRAEELIFATYEMAEDDAPDTGDIFTNPITPGQLARDLHARLQAADKRVAKDARQAEIGQTLEGRGHHEDDWG